MDGLTHTGRWLDIGAFDEVPRQGARVVATPGGDIAVFRTLDDAVFALDDHCPHKGGPLSQGIVHGLAVTCPLHNWVIDLATGEAAAPDHGCVRRTPVRVEDGRILIGLPVVAAAAP
jgi:nitrite reductase (NADH) small subunit